jgi:hypothetical protein
MRSARQRRCVRVRTKVSNRKIICGECDSLRHGVGTNIVAPTVSLKNSRLVPEYL